MAKQKTHKQFWKLGNRDVGTEMFDVNKNGELIIREGHYQYNVYDLVRKFGSSLEIFMPFVIEERLNKLIELFTGHTKQMGYKGKFFLPLSHESESEQRSGFAVGIRRCTFGSGVGK